MPVRAGQRLLPGVPARDLLEGGGDALLTEMKDDDLLKLVALDLHTASEE